MLFKEEQDTRPCLQGDAGHAGGEDPTPGKGAPRRSLCLSTRFSLCNSPSSQETTAGEEQVPEP